MSKISEEEIQKVQELKENHPEAYRALQDKAKWEKMGVYAVLEEWGDPREW